MTMASRTCVLTVLQRESSTPQRSLDSRKCNTGGAFVPLTTTSVAWWRSRGGRSGHRCSHLAPRLTRRCFALVRRPAVSRRRPGRRSPASLLCQFPFVSSTASTSSTSSPVDAETCSVHARSRSSSLAFVSVVCPPSTRRVVLLPYSSCS